MGNNRQWGLGHLQRLLLIRVLVIASLTLLAVGAVSPLLTTERFYFFSNTFSLASGLRQLSANGQWLIAAVVGLFSICVPVIKAGVIWIAASQHATRGPLFALADRFGKWSMLEVFIAALLIIALKLGPVVETTLHYGAWVLAASVLVSGIASQLVVHETRPEMDTATQPPPIFSSPLTLMLGAVAGAASATVLIGLLNPGLLNFDALLGSPEARCISRAVRLDRVYAESSGSQSEYVRRLQDIDTQSCPQAFTEAFSDYVEAWEDLDAIDADEGSEPSLLDRLGTRLGIFATRDETLAAIEASWQTIERIAGRYNVPVPAR